MTTCGSTPVNWLGCSSRFSFPTGGERAAALRVVLLAQASRKAAARSKFDLAVRLLHQPRSHRRADSRCLSLSAAAVRSLIKLHLVSVRPPRMSCTLRGWQSAPSPGLPVARLSEHSPV